MSISRREVNAPTSPRRRWRLGGFLAVLVMLTALGAHATVPARMKDGLSSSSMKVRLVAIAAVAKTKDPDAVALLKPLLVDEAPLVRAAAIDGLGVLRDVGSYAAIDALKDDKDPTVRASVKKAIKLLDTAAIRVDIGDVADLSGRNLLGVTKRLQDKFEIALTTLLRKDVVVARGGVDKGYGAILKIRAVTTGVTDGNGVLEVKCDMTLVELPGKILRLTSTAAAAAGVEGKMPASIEPELANDAIDACAPSLARDFADYIEQHRKR